MFKNTSRMSMYHAATILEQNKNVIQFHHFGGQFNFLVFI